MTEPHVQSGEANAETFTWHPEYRGRTRDSVVQELAHTIAMDQRQYELALSGAEKEENQALASVMELEKRWSPITFDWADSDPRELAELVTDFELERDRRQEMISYATYRHDTQPRRETSTSSGWRASKSDDDRRKIANLGAGLILATFFLVILVVVIILL